MTQYHEKVHWAIKTFNERIAAGQAVKDNLGLLGYVRKISNGKIPAWARGELTLEAKQAAEAEGFSI